MNPKKSAGIRITDQDRLMITLQFGSIQNFFDDVLKKALKKRARKVDKTKSLD